MAIDRWSPMGDMLTLRDAMNQLFQDSVVWPGSSAVSGGRTMMPLDVMENADDYVVCASMPGVKPDDVQITVQGDTLTIRGQTSSSLNQPQGQQGQGQGQGQPQGQHGQQSRQDIVQSQQGQTQGQGHNQGQSQSQSQGQGQNYLLRERKQASYFRQVTLPTMVNADKATAKFEHGELTITLPKAEEAKPKQIRVGSGQGQRTIEASSSSQAGSSQSSSSQSSSSGSAQSGASQSKSEQPKSEQPKSSPSGHESGSHSH